MGKRKSKGPKPVAKKKSFGLAKQFECLFCNHDKSVHVKMDRKLNIGFLSCKVCGQSFQSTIHSLSQEVDVYYDWVDACEAVNKSGANAAPLDEEAEEEISVSQVNPLRAALAKARGNAPGAADSYVNRGETDDFVVADDEDAEGEFIEEE